MGRIMVGLSSWSGPELVDSGFYPPDIKTPADRLRYYSQHFKVAEIDSSYHFFPTRHNLDLWLNNSPQDFVFELKAYSLLTQQPTALTALPVTIRQKYGGQIQTKGNVYLHHLPQEAINELWQIFSRTIDNFKEAGKLGAVFFQFPPWFHPSPENYDYIAACRERLAGYRIAVEFRAGSWLEAYQKQTLEFLRSKDIALVCVDEPQGFKSSVPPLLEATSSLCIIRFHGRNRENWEKKDIPVTDRFDYLYSEDELEEWAKKILKINKSVGETHVIFKNKHADYPVKNATQMKELLDIT